MMVVHTIAKKRLFRVIVPLAVVLAVLVLAVFSRQAIWRRLVDAAYSATCERNYSKAALLCTLSEYVAVVSFDRDNLSYSYLVHSTLKYQMGDRAEAEALLLRRQSMAAEAHGRYSVQYVGCTMSLARRLDWPGFYDCGEIYRTIIELHGGVLGICEDKSYPYPDTKLEVMSRLVMANYLVGDYDQSDAMYARLLTELKQIPRSYDTPSPLDPHRRLIARYKSEGNIAMARTVKQHLRQRILQDPEAMTLLHKPEKKWLMTQ